VDHRRSRRDAPAARPRGADGLMTDQPCRAQGRAHESRGAWYGAPTDEPELRRRRAAARPGLHIAVAGRTPGLQSLASHRSSSAAVRARWTQRPLRPSDAVLGRDRAAPRHHRGPEHHPGHALRRRARTPVTFTCTFPSAARGRSSHVRAAVSATPATSPGMSCHDEAGQLAGGQGDVELVHVVPGVAIASVWPSRYRQSRRPPRGRRSPRPCPPRPRVRLTTASRLGPRPGRHRRPPRPGGPPPPVRRAASAGRGQDRASGT
jgi:hypothetical protein